MIRPVLFLLLPTLVASPSFAKDPAWTGWLGPDRNGWVEGFTPPQPWPEKLKPVWTVEVGTGYGSPLVSGGRVYQHARQGGEEVVWCLDLADGRTIWRKSYPLPFEMGRGGERHGKGPKSSPVLDGGRLFTLSITGVLSAWDAASGKLHWRRDFVKRFKTPHPNWGAATSPLVDADRIFVHLGTCEKGALLALDVTNGKEIWSQDKHGHCYSSPLLVEIAGVRQVVEWNHHGLTAVDRGSGRILWEYPFPHRGSDQNMPTPAFHGGRILVGGENRGIRCVEASQRDGKWSVTEKWRTREVALNMATAVMNNGLLYGMSHFKTGQFFCLDPANGEVRWKGPPRVGQNVMFLSLPGFVLALLDRGELQVIEATPEAYRPVRKYRVAEGGTWAPPVLLPDSILVKDTRHLARWSLQLD
ncbi:MAG: PQQ-like beta-propeller repeat protein [Akkermansiaceae bacterium]|nr:PQQ-like beta-propeller repeat protein [Akkermansiaceae bacterium]